MQWFGEPWPSAELRAPVCEDDGMRVPPPPPGEECVLCNQPIQPGARGILMPHMKAAEDAPWISQEPAGLVMELRYSHLGCLLGNVGGEGISWREPEL